MPSPVQSHAEERRKHLAAMQRAVPVTRMVDYGVPLGDALHTHGLVATDDSAGWDEICERVAARHHGLAEAAEKAGRSPTAALGWRAASALLQCAQLAFNQDVPRKIALYEQAHAALARHAHLSGDLAEVRLPTPYGGLHGWTVRPDGTAATAAVIVMGGLSGWGSVYLDMGRALAARGLLAILAEGPGQGLTRLRGGMHLDDRTLPLFGAFLDHAESLGVRRCGVWGNSFGGLFAAQLAATDRRVQAVCINGAPMTPAVPSFRTAREQMEALFGVDEEASLRHRLQSLGMSPRRHRIDANLLVIQGGCDALVPLGEQASFFTLVPTRPKAVLTWPNGEHTIYNYAQERNARAADWFAEQLNPQAA
ncbi:alpha/beta hydrolase family protein [Variovorax paradoxus]|uniref:alpha/beta hydrolase family protein n=1 Tax=Variovorax paradoxus TaxID=34073 RepID=UPI00278A18C7|nr:prolyl oligopeptidase family serine peptidase [Variovorax paradoxus]MDP9928182.1 dienelactone hydrolase [Variovorax paradoxus]